jgi:carboxylesterase type B
MTTAFRPFCTLLIVGLLASVLAACTDQPEPKAQNSATPSNICDSSVATVTLPEDRGRLCGRLISNPQGQNSHAYLGIPFAEPPTGERRWTAPVAKAKLGSSIFKATRFGEACIQPSAALKGFSGSEDCLTLNIYKPSNASSEPLPVMVYIPGGGFLASQSPVELNGTALANKGVIVVTTNYRLGPLGFLRYTENDAGIQGNFGIQDQQLAMRWVKQNIAAFGGNPEQITLFGESAGAMSVGLHLFSIPSSNELFRAAVMESNIMGMQYNSAQTAATTGSRFVELLCRSYANENCAADGPWLRSLSTEAIAQAELLTLPAGGMPGLVAEDLSTGMVAWTPIVQVEPVLDQPDLGYSQGVTPRPYVFGVNRDEGAFFLAGPNTLTPEDYRQLLNKAFSPAQAEQILRYSEQGQRLYSPSNYTPRPGGGLTPASIALARLQTDYFVAAANLRAAGRAFKQQATAGVPSYGYHFVYQANFDFNGLLRCSVNSDMVCHTDEIPFVWSTFVEKNALGATVPVKDPGPTPAEWKLADAMTTAWAGFAKDPLQGWGHPQFNGKPSGNVVIWNDPVGQGPLMPPARYAFWEPFLP